MSCIFKTIIENIKSFFEKEEEKMAEPKSLPDAAAEIYDSKPVKIIEKKLPKETPPPIPTADELRKALNQQERIEKEMTEKSIEENKNEEEPFTFDIKEFEDAVEKVSTPTKREEHTTAINGYFHKLAEELEKHPERIEGDLLHTMRLYHHRRSEGKEPFITHQDITSSIKRRLRELQELESEWHSWFVESKDIERRMLSLEQEIEAKINELRRALKLSRNISLLTKEVDEALTFNLSDGNKLHSIAELKNALLNMSEETFNNHVLNERNDFANWIEDVFKNKELADTIRKAGNRRKMIKAINKYFIEKE